MKKVMVFGAFDILHPGHLSFFGQAKEHGDYLIAVIARDSTVEQVKGQKPLCNEKERLENVANLSDVDQAVLGDMDDPFVVISQHKPDIICFGYDQKYCVEEAKEYIQKHNLKVETKRLKSYQPKKYKSSFLKQGLSEEKCPQ